jgi:hypothetical protein
VNNNTVKSVDILVNHRIQALQAGATTRAAQCLQALLKLRSLHQQAPARVLVWERGIFAVGGGMWVSSSRQCVCIHHTSRHMGASHHHRAHTVSGLLCVCVIVWVAQLVVLTSMMQCCAARKSDRST